MHIGLWAIKLMKRPFRLLFLLFFGWNKSENWETENIYPRWSASAPNGSSSSLFGDCNGGVLLKPLFSQNGHNFVRALKLPPPLPLLCWYTLSLKSLYWVVDQWLCVSKIKERAKFWWAMQRCNNNFAHHLKFEFN